MEAKKENLLLKYKIKGIKIRLFLRATDFRFNFLKATTQIQFVYLRRTITLKSVLHY